MIPIYEPYLTKDILRYPKEALDSKWVSCIGPYLEKAEDFLKCYFKIPYVLLVNNGTSAVHLMSKAIKFKYPSIKKIIVPNNVYAAAWNGFVYDGYYDLIPVDCSVNTWNVDTGLLDKAIKEEENVALLVVHNMGNIINVPRIKEKYPKLVIVEDNCEGLFGKYQNKFSGTSSFCSAASFFGNKTITSGEGGAVFTADKKTFEYLNKLHGQGQSSTRYIHDALGYNYRMTNVQAALLYGQLLQADNILTLKEKVRDFYRTALSHEDICFQEIEEGTRHSNWMVGVRIKGGGSFEALSKYLKNKGVDNRPCFYPMSYHPYLSRYSIPEEEVNAKALNREGIILPSYPALKKKYISYIGKTLRSYIREAC